MFNPYAKYSKYLLKSERVFIQRQEGSYYISDGYTALKLPERDYSYLIKPTSGIFIDLEDGERAAKTNNIPMPEKGTGADIVQIFERTRAEKPVIMTPFLMEDRSKKKVFTIRFFLCEKEYIGINSVFVEAMQDFANEWKSPGRWIDPLVYSNNDGSIAAIMLPIRYNQDVLKQFIAPGDTDE